MVLGDPPAPGYYGGSVCLSTKWTQFARRWPNLALLAGVPTQTGHEPQMGPGEDLSDDNHDCPLTSTHAQGSTSRGPGDGNSLTNQ